MVKNVTERAATFETGWRVETTDLAEVKGNLSGCHHSCKFTWLGTRSESASCTVHIIEGTELQKRANRANQLVLIFGKSTQKTGENTRKQAKNRRFFCANFLGGKIGRC